MCFKDKIARLFHMIVFFWHANMTYGIRTSGSDKYIAVGFKCDCGKEIGDNSWSQFFE